MLRIKWHHCFAGCPSEWLNYKDKCYFFSKDLHSYDDAKATCESMSASLLIISDKEEQVSLVVSFLPFKNKQRCNGRKDADFVSRRGGAEMAKEAGFWKRLLLDGSDRQGGGERLALAGRDRTYFHVSIESEPTTL